MHELHPTSLDHHHGAMALCGVVSVVFGVAAMFWTDLTVSALVVLFGISAIADGAVSLISVVRLRHPNRAWHAVAGVAGILVGIVAFVWPSITAAGLTALIGAWFAITGIEHVVTAFDMAPGTAGRWVLAAGGVVGTAFGLFLVARPGRGALALVTAIGLVAVVRGVVLIGAAVTARRTTETLSEAAAR